MFDTVERDALAPLPSAPFVLAVWSSARVGPDIHATVSGTLYSVPWRHIGDRLDVRTTESVVQLVHHGQLVKTHPRKLRGKQTEPRAESVTGREVPMTMTAQTAVLEVSGVQWATQQATVGALLGRRPGVRSVDANPVA